MLQSIRLHNNGFRLLFVFISSVGVVIFLLNFFSNASATAASQFSPNHFRVFTLLFEPYTDTIRAHPVAMTVQPTTGEVYIINTGSREVVVLDGTAIRERIPLSTSIYKACLPENRPSSGLLCLTDISAHPVSGYVYVTQWQTDRNYVISGTEVIDSFIGTPRWNGPAIFAPSPSSAAGYVGATWGADHIGFVCGTDPITELEIGGSANPIDIAVTNRNGYDAVYIVERGNDRLLILENHGSCEEPDVIVKTVAVGDAPTAVAVHPITGLVFVVNGGSGDVSVVDADRVIATVPIGTGDWPPLGPSTFDGYVTYGSTEILAISPQTGDVYVANWADNTVTIINEQVDNITSIEVGSNPNSTLVNPISGLIYVANIGDNTVSIIDGHKVVSTLDVATYPIALEVVPERGYIYVAGRDADAVTIVEEAFQLFLPMIQN